MPPLLHEMAILSLNMGSWGPLGRLLGASWEPLGASWKSLWRLFDFGVDFGSKKGAQREAFWEPKRVKNRSEIEVQI